MEEIILSLFTLEKLYEDAGISANITAFSGITLAINQDSKEAVDAIYKWANNKGAGDLNQLH